MLIDTHCHLNDSAAYPDPKAEIEFARENGVERLFVVGIEPKSWQRGRELAEEFAEVHAIVGWHPNHAAEYQPSQLSDLAKLLEHPKVIALGEIGLDYHWDFATPEQQRQALVDQLQLAREMDMPVVFHCREAYADLLSFLEDQPPHSYLFHCFAGNSEDARRALALGALFGVDGPITYKNANTLREVIAGLPKDRVVVETDSPYMTPVPHRGKPNRPGYVRHVNEMLANLWSVAPEESARITTANAERFFRLAA